MTKLEVQQRVLKNGKPLDLDKFRWDENTNTFSSNEVGLVLDFKSISNCTFKTSSYCTFKTSSYCTFKTGYECTFDTDSYCIFNTGAICTFKTGYECTFDTRYDCIFNAGSKCTFKTGPDCIFNTGSKCTFKTGSDCIFNTGSSCTFKTGYGCVIVRRDIFQVIQPKEGETIQLCPDDMKGYLSDGYLNGDESLGKHIIADGILSKIISKKAGVYKVINHGEQDESYLVEKNGIYSHGKTLKEAKDGLVYKLANRDTSMYEDYTLETKLTKDEAIVMYMNITGACQYGTRQFVESQDIPDELTVKDVIDITKGRYGNEELVKFIVKKQ